MIAACVQEGVRLAHKLAQLEEEDRKAAAFKLEAARDLMSSVVAGAAPCLGCCDWQTQVPVPGCIFMGAVELVSCFRPCLFV